jgi:uncharacterized membrane protein SirB2
MQRKGGAAADGACSALMDRYMWMKQAHTGLVLLSLAGFALRGLAVQFGARWPLHAGVRRASVVVDSLLLAAGLALWAQLDWAAMDWLFAKFGWLLAYIVLGSLALGRARSRGGQIVCLLLALLCAAQLVATARAHHPLGLLA